MRPRRAVKRLNAAAAVRSDAISICTAFVAKHTNMHTTLFRRQVRLSLASALRSPHRRAGTVVLETHVLPEGHPGVGCAAGCWSVHTARSSLLLYLQLIFRGLSSTISSGSYGWADVRRARFVDERVRLRAHTSFQ